MKNSAKASDLSLIEPVISKYKNTSGSLITVLQEIQDIYGYLPEDALCHAAIEMGIAPATVFGVATFYAQFRFTPVGRYFIMLCQGTACHVNGSEMIEKAVFETLGIHNGETTPDGLFTLSKGYILPIGATLLYLIPVVIAPAYLTGIHPLASVMGIYPHISEAAAAMVESLMQGVLFNTSPLVCVGSLLLIGATFAAASVVALKKQSY